MAKAAAKTSAKGSKPAAPARSTRDAADNDAVNLEGTAPNPAPVPGETSQLAPPRPAHTSLQRDQNAQRTAESLRDRAAGKVDSKADESAGQRRAARANALAGITPGEGRVKVRATEAGYYDNARRRPGDVFTISDRTLEEDVLDGKKVRRKKGELADFSARWMEVVDDDVRESLSTSNEAIRKKHDEIIDQRRSGANPVDADVDPDPLGVE